MHGKYIIDIICMHKSMYTCIIIYICKIIQSLNINYFYYLHVIAYDFIITTVISS